MSSSPGPANDEKAMKLTLDMGCPMNLRINGFAETFKAVLIGQAYQEYLVVKTTVPKDFERDFLPGVSLHVNYQTQGLRFHFESRILGFIDRPYPLTFITYPNHVEVIKKRSHDRTSCHIPSIAHLNHRTIKGVVSDISRRGCRFNIRLPDHLMPRQITLLDDITLSFPVPGSHNTETLYGAVRNTMIDREKISMGIEFMDMDPDLLACIDDHLYRSDNLDMMSH